MTAMSRSAFAARIGVRPSYVTKLGEQGRLVLTADGLVDAEASERLIEQTAGDRPDVADRHAAARGAKKTAGRDADIAAPEKTPQRPTAQAEAAEKIGSSLQAARAVKEKYAAMRAKIEYEMLVGDLVPKDDVETALRFVGAAVRSAMEVFPDQITPLVAPTLDMAEVHEILTQSCHEVLRRVADDIAKQKAAIQPKETAA